MTDEHHLCFDTDELFAINVLLSLDPQINMQPEQEVQQERLDKARMSARWKVRRYIAGVESCPTDPAADVVDGQKAKRAPNAPKRNPHTDSSIAQ